MKKTLLASLLALGVFFFAPTTFASVLYSSTDDALISSAPSVSGNYSYPLGTGLHGDVTSLVFKFYIINSPAPYNGSASGSVEGIHLVQCDDSAYSVNCITVMNAGSNTLVSSSGTTYERMNTVATTTLISTKYYRLNDTSNGSPYQDGIYTNALGLFTYALCDIPTNCSIEPVNSSGLIWNSGATTTLVFTSSSTVDITRAFNSGGLSTTTTGNYCDTNLPYDNSSITQATLTAIPNGFCRLSFFLVVPTTDSVNQFATLNTALASRFPFSYVAGIASTWSGLVASTTANSPSYTFNFASAGIGSTTSMGNILPNVVAFSSSTVEHYFPAGTFDALKFLASLALILTLFADIFFTSRNLINH